MTKRILPDGVSAAAIANRMGRTRLWRASGGKCFYCGCPIAIARHRGERDWLLLSKRHQMVREHVTPISRGGSEQPSNRVAACAGCNYAKGAFTLEEFRLVRALVAGDLNYRFSGEPQNPNRQRDWLCCHSTSFERMLVVHNLPSAQDGYALRVRTRDLLPAARVRPVTP